MKKALPKIMYIQYTNPAAYPPLQHSSRILADSGWRVLFLGTGGFGNSDILDFAPHPNIEVRKLSFVSDGMAQKLHYIFFCLWVFIRALLWRPKWIYASELFSSLPALTINSILKTPIIYHEHDSPLNSSKKLDGQRSMSKFMGVMLNFREKISKKAYVCILPNEERVKRFIHETGRAGDTLCVWNCPRLKEVGSQRKLPGSRGLVLYYHGTISRDYLPLSILKAMSELPSEISLRIIGYETIGSLGYISELREEANRLGITKRLEILKPIPRYQIWGCCSSGDIGLAFIPAKNQDTNNINKTGASVKVFDYMACGLALLVSDLLNWRHMYVESGYGLACDPESPNDIVRTLRWFLEHSEETREMGERGRQKILSEWNYEMQFEPVLKIINRS